METMDGAQVWTMIGAFTALMMGMLTVVSTLFIRVLRSEIGGLRNEMTARFDAVNTRFDAVGTRIDGVNTRIDGLDLHVQALVKRTFGLDRE
ncbi:hypothetical protein [Microbacterium sp. CH1]|uniref:hypothetical protein n=1 Tax=Microbacterium sp. CH1 TaxID=1770208 RepID=UPI0007893259|nr:hypothetical protein [Microbacterium sp. CH1]KYJ98219.1 hypothetical protein AUV07_13195 [Microbacterium sp. CH1]